MKKEVPATVILICGLIIGVIIGGLVIAAMNDTSGFQGQINDLKDQNANQTKQVNALQEQIADLNRTQANQTSNIVNLSSSLSASRQALLTPTLGLTSVRSSEASYDLIITGVSNQGIRADLVSTNVTPSNGVVVGSWNTHDQGLMEGDSFSISNVTMGARYEIRLFYMPTWGEMAAYFISVPGPVGEFNATKVGTGVYNVTLVSLSSENISTDQITLVITSPSNPGSSWSGNLSVIPPYHKLAIGSYLLGTNLTEPGFDYTVDLFYNPSGSKIASITISIPGATLIGANMVSENEWVG